MSELTPNQVFRMSSGVVDAEGLYRILWVDHRCGEILIIPLDQHRRNGPKRVPLERVTTAIQNGTAEPATVKADPRALMSDEQLALVYPSKRLGQPSFPVKYRAEWWSIIEPIVAQAHRYFARQCSLNDLVEPRATERRASVHRIYEVLYRFWAAGSIPSAVLPATSRCGARGRPRAGGGFSLGRKKLLIGGDSAVVSNFKLTEKDIARLQFGWRQYLEPGSDVYDAYNKTITAFYYSHFEDDGGTPRAVQLPPEKRPSVHQFRYHGPRQPGGMSASRQLMGQREWFLNYRPLGGSPPRGFRHIGAVAQADAATNDLHLLSVFDRSKNVGTCHWILMVDEFTSVIAGVHVCWNVSGEAAQLAMLNAASSKVEFGARYGIKITDDDIPAIVFSHVRCDRGEFHNDSTRKKFAAINSGLEYVQTGRADLKGLCETDHGAMHGATSHKLPGTTRGRPRKRGEPDPALDACLNIYEFTGELLRAVIIHNTVATVEDRLTTEMIRDGVKPTRMSIWKWAKQKGYVSSAPCDYEHMIVNLCPQVEAVVKPNGIFLVHSSAESGGYSIVISRLRYVGAIAERREWFETSRRSGSFRITVFHNPFDLRKVWFVDTEYGLQTLDLVTDDPLLGRLANLRDLVVAETELAAVGRDIDQREGLQLRADAEAYRKVTVKKAQAEKKVALEKLGKAASKSARLRGRRENRVSELASTGNAPMLNPASNNIPAHEVDDNASTVVSLMSRQKSGRDQCRQAIEEWLDSGDDT